MGSTFDGFTEIMGEAVQQTLGMKMLKEITGANAAEEANALAREQFEESSAKALKDREDSIAQVQRNEMAMSQSAGSRAASSTATTNTNKRPIGDVSDFLGL